MIKILNSLHKGGNVVDLTTATEDYPLEIGETATITYTSATSVPLHVATVEGVYEILYLGSGVAASLGMGYLKPNNTTYTNAFSGENVYHQVGGTNVGFENSTTYSAFNAGSNHVINGVALAFTTTTCKSFQYSGIEGDTTSTLYSSRKTCLWRDTTTQWVSLGTIQLPTAQSGKIIIRRII